MKLPIGMEISEQYLKFVVARALGPQPRLSDCIVEPIASFTKEQITDTVTNILRKDKLKPKSLTLSISRNLVTVRNLHLPSQDKQEIAQMIDLNVSRIVPYKKDDIIFGYQILGLDEMGYTKVILAIIKSDVIRRQSEIIERAGLFIDKISLSSYGVWEWIFFNCRSEINQTDLYLLLDIDSGFTDFIIFSHHGLLFTRSINVGLAGIRDTQDILVTKLLGEIKQSLIMFYNEEINKKPVAVFISGAAIKESLSETIETELGMPVRLVADPYLNEILKSKGRKIPQDISLSGVAELALRDSERRIYFVLPEIQVRKSLREKTKDLIILGSFIIYLFTIICALFLGKIYNQQSYLKKLNQGCLSVEQELGDLLGQIGKIEFVKDYLINRRMPLVVFSQLEKISTDAISLNSVVMDEQNKVTLRGQAMQLSDVFKFINTLEKEKYFKDVQTKYTRKKRVKDKDLTDFELSFTAINK